MNEIKVIKNVDYSERPIIDIARDLFVIAAVKGLRVSDYKSLNTSEVKQHNLIKYLEIKTLKTGKIVHIPLHSFITEILDKRDGEFPKTIAEQEINGSKDYRKKG